MSILAQEFMIQKNKAEEYYDIKETEETKRKLLEYIGYFV